MLETVNRKIKSTKKFTQVRFSTFDMKTAVRDKKYFVSKKF